MKAYLSSDGRSDATGKTLAVQLSQAGASFANPSAGVVNATEIGNGWYSYTLSVADMSVLGDLVVRFTGTGVDTAERILPIVNPRNGGLSALPDTAVTSNNSLLTSGTGTDQLAIASGKVLLQATQTGVTIPTVTTVTEKTGYTLLQAFPANFSALAITSGGAVTAGTGDAFAYLTTNMGLLGANLSGVPKVGYKLAADGLASISTWTVNITGSISSVTNAIVLPTAPTDWISSASVSSAAVSKIQSGLATTTSISAIPTNPLLATDTRLNNLDATVSSRMATFTYTTPPTVIQIRQEMDTNSTKLDTNVASRLATSAYMVSPSAVQIRQELDTNSTKLTNLDAAVSSRTVPSDITAGLTYQGYTAARAAYLDTLNGLVNSIWNAFAYSTTSFKSIIANFRFTVPNQVDANSLTSVGGGGGGGTIQNIVYITPALAQASLTPNKILAKRGDLFTVALPAMGNISSRTGTNRLVFTVKTSVDDADSAAILQIVEGIGLTVFQGAPATDPTQGSITVSDATLGIAIVSVNGSKMAQMLVRDYVWDQQAILPTGPLSPNQGVFSVYGDVTRLT
jgi:hypothetical protein